MKSVLLPRISQAAVNWLYKKRLHHCSLQLPRIWQQGYLFIHYILCNSSVTATVFPHLAQTFCCRPTDYIVILYLSASNILMRIITVHQTAMFKVEINSLSYLSCWDILKWSGCKTHPIWSSFWISTCIKSVPSGDKRTCNLPFVHAERTHEGHD